MIEVRDANDSDKEIWNQIAAQSEDGWAFHLFEWKEVLPSFSLKPRYLLAEEEGEVVGILPFCEYNAVAGLRFFDSLGIGHAGVAVKPGADKQKIHSAFVDKIDKLAKKRAAAFAVLRCSPDAPLNITTQCKVRWLAAHGFEEKPHYTFLLDLEKTKDELWLGFDRSNRKQIKKAQKHDFKLKKVSLSQGMKDFYNLLDINYKSTGLVTPPYSLFDNLVKIFGSGDVLELHFVMKDKEPVAGLLSICYKNVVYTWFRGSNPKFNKEYPNHLMYWSMMQEYKERGIKWFDFVGVRPYQLDGSDTKNLGVYDFKRSWGGELIRESIGIKTYRPIVKSVFETGFTFFNAAVPTFIKKLLGRDRISLFGLL